MIDARGIAGTLHEVAVTVQEPPSSRGTRTLRFRVRSGLGVPFTRLDMTLVDIGVLADSGGYSTLVEIVRRGEGVGTASRAVWHVNPSKRQATSIARDQAEALLGESLFRARYARSRLIVGGRPVVLVEFDHPVVAGPFVLIEARPGERVVPPDWAVEDVSHDPSTEIMQVVLNAWRESDARGEEGE